MKKSDKKGGGKVFMIVMTAVLLLLSAAAYGARYYLSGKRKEQKSEMTVPPEAVVVRDNFSETETGGLKAGSIVGNDPSVKVTEGTAFVRFNVELTDSDGVPFSQKLEEKQRAIEEYKSMMDPDSPSYQSFLEAYHKLLNEYNMIYAKGQLAFQTICRDESLVGEESEPSIDSSRVYPAGELSVLSDEGKISYIVDEDTAADGVSDFVQLYDGDNPFCRQYVYKDSVSAGESCTLFTNIIVPVDWSYIQTELTIYEEDENGSFYETKQGQDNITLIGDGFGLNVSAEIVDCGEFENALAAFEAAENVSAVTECVSSRTSSENE